MKISHSALKIFKCWVPQFCIFNFDFYILKLTNQFESVTQNKPNSRNAKMKLNFYSTKDYENQGRLRTPGKQTQSNPICSELACPELACGELVEPVEWVEPISKGIPYYSAWAEFCFAEKSNIKNKNYSSKCKKMSLV